MNMENKEYKYVKFLPWVGEYYKSGDGFQGKKILILGDSHYCETSANRNHICNERWVENGEKCSFDCMDCDCYKMNRSLMDNDYLPYRKGDKENKKEFRSHSCFEKIIYGRKSISTEDSLWFWDNVVFYNYVQHSQSGTSKESEHPEAAPMYMSAINELLEDLDPTPTHIIVWSQRCFNLLPSGVEEDEEFVIEEYKTRVRRYCIKGKIIKAIAMNHPSRAGQAEWHSILKAFLELDD